MKPSRGYALLELSEAKEKEGDFFVQDAGNHERWAKVHAIGPPFKLIGPPVYSVGDIVLVPNIKGQTFEEGGKTYMLFEQSLIGVSR